MTQDVTIIKVPEVCQASVFLKSMSWIICPDEFFRASELKLWMRCIRLRCSSGSLSACWVVRAIPREGCRSLQYAIVPQLLPSPMPDRTFGDRPRLRALSAPRTFELLTQNERARCFHPAAAACFGRRLLAECRTAPNSKVSKHCFVNFDSGFLTSHSSKMSC